LHQRVHVNKLNPGHGTNMSGSNTFLFKINLLKRIYNTKQNNKNIINENKITVHMPSQYFSFSAQR